MSQGQEGDTRPVRRLRSTDYYDSKAAYEASLREPQEWPRCLTCGQEIRGKDWNGYCMRCSKE